MKTIKILKTNSSNDENKGSLQESFSIEEYNKLKNSGKWNGGYVENLGYVPSNAENISITNPLEGDVPEGSAYGVGEVTVYLPHDNAYPTQIFSYNYSADVEGSHMDLDFNISMENINHISNPTFSAGLLIYELYNAGAHVEPIPIPGTTNSGSFSGSCEATIPSPRISAMYIKVSVKYRDPELNDYRTESFNIEIFRGSSFI